MRLSLFDRAKFQKIRRWRGGGIDSPRNARIVTITRVHTGHPLWTPDYSPGREGGASEVNASPERPVLPALLQLVVMRLWPVHHPVGDQDQVVTCVSFHRPVHHSNVLLLVEDDFVELRHHCALRKPVSALSQFARVWYDARQCSSRAELFFF